MPSLLVEILEEAAIIWLRERDGEPTSIRRARLDLMLHEYATQLFATLENSPPAPPPMPRRPRLPDWKKLAAHDLDDEPMPLAS